MKTNILFVDDEPLLLQGLRRTLRDMRRQWQMAFVDGGAQALDYLAEHDVDVVVSDMRMPGMDGAELLDQVRRRYPHVVRIILSGQSDKEAVLKTIGSSHIFLAKPCEPESLRSTVERACRLHSLLQCPELKQLISRIDTLPSVPTLYTRLHREIQSPDCSMQTVGEIISQDLAMTAKMLQLVNSSFFGLKREIADPVHAVNILGVDMIKSLVLGTGAFTQLHGQEPLPLSIDALWTHSLQVASIAKKIMECEQMPRMQLADAAAAGMLHDIGKLVLAARMGDRYRDVLVVAQETALPLWKLEQQLLGATHCQVGAYLLALWGLGDAIASSVAFHHHPADSLTDEFNTTVAVHVADALAYALNDPTDCALGEIDQKLLHTLGKGDRLPIWKSICEEMYRSESKHEQTCALR